MLSIPHLTGRLAKTEQKSPTFVMTSMERAFRTATERAEKTPKFVVHQCSVQKPSSQALMLHSCHIGFTVNKTC